MGVFLELEYVFRIARRITFAIMIDLPMSINKLYSTDLPKA
jgi:hypothetical protein